MEDRNPEELCQGYCHRQVCNKNLVSFYRLHVMCCTCEDANVQDERGLQEVKVQLLIEGIPQPRYKSKRRHYKKTSSVSDQYGTEEDSSSYQQQAVSRA